MVDRVKAALCYPLERCLAYHIHPLAFSETAVFCDPEFHEPCSARVTVFDLAGEERMLQDIVDEVLANGVWILPRLRVRELVETSPRIRLAVTAVLSRKE